MSGWPSSNASNASKRGRSLAPFEEQRKQSRLNHQQQQHHHQQSWIPPPRKSLPIASRPNLRGSPEAHAAAGTTTATTTTATTATTTTTRTSSSSHDDTIGSFTGKPSTLIGNRYKIVNDVGKGTFGRVVAAQDMKGHSITHKVVAIKIIRAVVRYGSQAEIEARILKRVNKYEAGNSAGKGHRDSRGTELIVRLLDTFWHADGKASSKHFCLAFERLGVSLYDFMEKHEYRPLPMACVWDLGHQLLDALQFLHELKPHSLTHTDLKLENILLQDPTSAEVWRDGVVVPRSTRIKLIDFGGATYDNEHKSKLISTRQYRAPEVILEQGWSTPADIWSAGCILGELALGELLFSTHGDAEHLKLMERRVGRFPNGMLKADSGASTLSKRKLEYVRSTLGLEREFEDKGRQFVWLLRDLLVLDPRTRAMAGPLWPLIKMLIKKLGTWLVAEGKNPDAVPYLLFAFDATAAMSSNFLFLFASDVSSVFTMISDVVENLVIALRVVFMVQASRNANVDRDNKKKDDDISDLKQHLRRLDKNAGLLHKNSGVLRARVARLEMEEAIEGVDLELEIELLLAPANGDGVASGRAMRLLLAFLASEMSEMLCSAWCMIMLLILYYGPNKQWMYTIDEFDDEDFKRSLWFSTIDFGLEFATFAVMLLVFSLHANINVYGVGFQYLTDKGLFAPVMAIAFTITFTSFAFFVKHYGVDPGFMFDEFTAESTSLVTNVVTNIKNFIYPFALAVPWLPSCQPPSTDFA